MAVAPFPSAQTSDEKLVQLLSQNSLCGLSNSSNRMILLLNAIEGLTVIQKTTLIDRYISVKENLQKRARIYSISFHIGRSVVTVGSLIVPALLSIQYTGQSQNAEDITFQMYWLTWFVSLLVTTCNGILTLFKIDKKYYFLHTTLEQLSSETHQYLYLSGKYAGYYTKGITPTHANQYVFFVHNIEKIKLKQVEEEYFKLIETSGEKQHTPHQTTELDAKSIAGLYAPTPQQNELIAHRDAILARAISGRQVENPDGGSTGQGAGIISSSENRSKEVSSTDLPTLL
jgi:hypothetical protein